MKSICFVHKDIGDIDRGGLCVLFKTLATGLRGRGYKVSIITSQPLKMKAIDVYQLERLDDPIAYSKAVTGIVNTVMPDVVECSNWKFELLDYARQEHRQSKVVVRCDPASTTLFPGTNDLEEFEKELCQRADRLLAVSNFAKQDVMKAYKVKDVEVVYNGVTDYSPKFYTHLRINSGVLLDPLSGQTKPLTNVAISSLLSGSPRNIFWVGKATVMKGYDLLEHIVERSGNDLRFIVNLGHSRDLLHWAPSNYPKCYFVQDLTKADQLALMSSADAYLSTSRVEGFGISVAEALAVGLPTYLNSNCEVFKEFLPNDAVVMVDCNNVEQTVQELSKNQPAKVIFSRKPSAFNVSTMIEQSLSHYNQLI